MRYKQVDGQRSGVRKRWLSDVCYGINDEVHNLRILQNIGSDTMSMICIESTVNFKDLLLMPWSKSKCIEDSSSSPFLFCCWHHYYPNLLVERWESWEREKTNKQAKKRIYILLTMTQLVSQLATWPITATIRLLDIHHNKDGDLVDLDPRCTRVALRQCNSMV